MTELTAEAQIALNQYLEKREKRLFVISASTVVGVVALIGGFFTYLVQDARSRAETETARQFQNYRETFLDPVLEKVRKDIAFQNERFNKLNSQIRGTFGNISETTKNLEDLRMRTEAALEGLNKAGDSLVFGEAIIELRTDIMKLQGQIVNNTASDAAPGEADGDPSVGEAYGLE